MDVRFLGGERCIFVEWLAQVDIRLYGRDFRVCRERWVFFGSYVDYSFTEPK